MEVHVPSGGAARPSVPERTALEVVVRGVVQGVGFRPFVHRLALRHGLSGWVRNEPGAVRIVAEGAPDPLASFVRDLRREAPPLAHIEDVACRPTAATGHAAFEVRASDLDARGRLPVPPDVAVCDACASEMKDPSNRRYRYPFITCTDCGPRFTVVESMPYDRARTTMRPFVQCPACAAEYGDPHSRRYHSETNSCPECGPRVWLERDGARTAEGAAAIDEAARALRSGQVVAIRGVGGFHLAVDATDELAVKRLRSRKRREAKPLAVMVRTLGQARRLARLSPEEAEALASRERPIVLVERRRRTPLAPSVAPGMGTVGLLLAYTPLHRLILSVVRRPLVMTSGNASDEPIATGNDEARVRLAGIADAFLLHDRGIVSRCDDSLVRVARSGTVMLRRARGFAPLPIEMPVPAPRPILAVGPHLKNTLTLAAEDGAWVSQHVGDLENLETLTHFRNVLDRMRTLLRIEPESVVRDLHPGYLSTRVAEQSGLRELPPVQHHHAHIAAVLGEHGLHGPVLGVAYDGTGYGADGRVWGGEFLAADLTGYRRLAHLRYAPLPGGDAAARAPWRVAAGYLSLDPGARRVFQLAFRGVEERERASVERQLERGINAPAGSSMGRLFDAAAAVLGIRQRARFEGQAPMELEALAGRRAAAPLPFPEREEGGDRVLDPLPLLEALGEMRAHGADPADLAARFHESVVAATVATAARLCEAESLGTVALGGGCFQNVRLLDGVVSGLRARGLRVLTPRRLGPNDGAVSYGQAVVAAARLHDCGG